MQERVACRVGVEIRLGSVWVGCFFGSGWTYCSTDVVSGIHYTPLGTQCQSSSQVDKCYIVEGIDAKVKAITYPPLSALPDFPC